MKIILLLSLLLMNELCFGMKEHEQHSDASFLETQKIKVITSDQKDIIIDPNIAQCMDLFVEGLDEEDRKRPFTLLNIDFATFKIIVDILEQQKIKPFTNIIRKYEADNKKLLIDYKNKVEKASEKLNKEETFEDAKTELKVPQELKTLLSTISNQGLLIKKLNAFSFERNAVEKICKTLDFTQMLSLIAATEFLRISFLNDILVTIASTKKINPNQVLKEPQFTLSKIFINRILHQKLFAIRKTLPIDIYTRSKRIAIANPNRKHTAPMQLTLGGKYLIYESFESKGWFSKEILYDIVFWDCENNKKALAIPLSGFGSLCWSPDQKYFRMFYTDYSEQIRKMGIATYNSRSLENVPSSKNPYDPIKVLEKNIYIFDAENIEYPSEKTILQPFLTDDQIKESWDTGDVVALNNEQKENESKVKISPFSDPYERHSESKKLLLSMTSWKKYITINSTQDFSCVKIIPTRIDEREFDIEKVAFSPSGKYLAACGKIGFPTRSGAIWKPTLKVWDTADWSCVGTIIDEKNALPKERTNTFSALCFSPDDSMVAVSNEYKKEVYFCGPLNVPQVNLAQLNYCMYHMQENGKVDIRLRKLYNTLPISIKNNLVTPPWDISEVTKQEIETIIEGKVDSYKAQLFGSKRAQSLLKKNEALLRKTSKNKALLRKARIFNEALLRKASKLEVNVRKALTSR